MARPFSHPAASDISIDGVLHALADPVRRSIVAKLMESDGMSCSKACDALPPSTISHHYKVLREAGIIRSRKEGVSVINCVRKQELENLFPKLLLTILKFTPVPTPTPKKRFPWNIGN